MGAQGTVARWAAGFLLDLRKIRALSAMARFSTTNQLNAAMGSVAVAARRKNKNGLSRASPKVASNC
ncbi:Uncharacterised protein [Mycobacteroides abscessus subsp. abscessus]|nr:Uncharacterised protein [Mycobacteroides abscessus subsp. abscessus]